MAPYDTDMEIWAESQSERIRLAAYSSPKTGSFVFGELIKSIEENKNLYKMPRYDYEPEFLRRHIGYGDKSCATGYGQKGNTK